jgi:PAS domain S-box-containing protein
MSFSADQIARSIVRQVNATRRRRTIARYILSLGFVGGLFALMPHTPLDGPVGGVVALTALIICCWFSGIGPALLMPLTVWLVSQLRHEPAARFELPSGQELMTFVSLSILTGAVGLAGQFRGRLRLQALKHDAQLREQARALSAARIVFRDLDGRITSWSEGAEEMYGWSSDEAVGQNIDELLHSEPSVSPAQIDEQLQHCGRWRGEVLYRRKDGEPVHVMRHSILYCGEGGRRSGVAEVHTDITDLRRVEAELRESNRRKSHFVAILAHELRNPLAPLRSGLDLLRMTGSSASDRDVILGTMQRQLHHLVRLVDDLLDVSRIDSGKIELHPAPIVLAEIIDDAVASCRHEFEASGRQLTVSLPKQPIRLEGDDVRLVQVFSNLLSNAVKFSDPGDAIAVTAELDGDQVIIRVRDSGIGMTRESLSQVFEMFSQVEDLHRRSRDGLGLGLSIVRTLVEMHGGTVAAHSDGPGLGSEFVVRLPAAGVPADAEDEPLPASAEQNGQPHPQRVLVVDDNRDAAAMLHLMLNTQGYDCRSVFDGPSALAAASEFSPHAVVLDLGMPGMNGLEVARELRRDRRYQKVLLIAVTGWDKEEDRRLTAEAGFDHHFAKPVSIDRLREVIGSIDPTDGACSGNSPGPSAPELC